MVAGPDFASVYVGFSYRWIAIFRNPAFPIVSRNMPRSAVLVVPLALAGVWVHRTLEPNFYQGTVVVVLKEPRPGSERGQVFVRLSAGPTVQADYDGTWPVSMVQGRFGGKIRLEPVPAGGLMAHWNQCSPARLKGLGTCVGGGTLFFSQGVPLILGSH